MTDLFPENVFTDVDELRTFVLAGKAKFTIRSEKTMRHFTYKVRKPSEGEMRFVHRLVENNAYAYLGVIRSDGHFTSTHKTSFRDKGSLGYTAFEWFWRWVSDRGKMPINATVWHEGRCGACGLELTDPVSIKAGYGPHCRRLMLRHGMIYDR